MEVCSSGLELAQPAEGQHGCTTGRSIIKRDPDRVLEEDAELKGGNSSFEGPKIVTEENLVIHETKYITEECELLLNQDGIKQEILELEEYKLNCTVNDARDVERADDTSKCETVEACAVEPQIRKELVIRLEKLDYSTLVKPTSNQYRPARKVCEHCGQTFAYQVRLAKHRVRVHGSTETPVTNGRAPNTTVVRNFPCDQCDKAYHLQTTLAIHKAKVHGVGEAPPKLARLFKHTCKHCGKNITSWKPLLYHLKHIHGETVDKAQIVRCVTCQAKFTSAKELEGHYCNRKTLAKSVRRFKCDLCDNAYLTKKCLESHFSVHPEYQHCKCDQCPMGFFKERELDKHKHLKHNAKYSFECQTCGKQFKTRENWIRHEENHTNDCQMFCCDQCGKKYKNHALFRTHKFNVHGEHVSEIAQVKPILSCPICDKVFKGRNSLTHHMRDHNLGRRFKCSFPSCGKSFFTGPRLKLHNQSHTKDYKYKCKFCEYGTIARKMLVKHEQKMHNYDRFANESGSASVEAGKSEPL